MVQNGYGVLHSFATSRYNDIFSTPLMSFSYHHASSNEMFLRSLSILFDVCMALGSPILFALMAPMFPYLL